MYTNVRLEDLVDMSNTMLLNVDGIEIKDSLRIFKGIQFSY